MTSGCRGSPQGGVPCGGGGIRCGMVEGGWVGPASLQWWDPARLGAGLGGRRWVVVGGDQHVAQSCGVGARGRVRVSAIGHGWASAPGGSAEVSDPWSGGCIRREKDVNWKLVCHVASDRFVPMGCPGGGGRVVPLASALWSVFSRSGCRVGAMAPWTDVRGAKCG